MVHFTAVTEYLYDCVLSAVLYFTIKVGAEATV